MFALGFAAGLLAALLQSMSYVCSRFFTAKHGSAFTLTVYSQIIMAMMGLPCLLLLTGTVRFPWSDRMFLLSLAGMAVFGAMGQYGFARTIRLVEASRLSSMLGAKIVFLGLVCSLLPGRPVTALQWAAILLSSAAGIGMNFTGGHIPVRAFGWLAMTLCGYVGGDLCATELVLRTGGGGQFLPTLGATALAYFVTGVCFLPGLLKTGWNTRKFVDAAPFGVIWFAAMIALFFCFGTLGVIFGNILQAFRGVISVAIGAVLLKWGWTAQEPAVGRGIWIRRFLMAVLMTLSMALFSLGKG